MALPTTLQGRPFGPPQSAQVQALPDEGNGQWSRYRLSRELAVLWNWRTAHGQLKDMAAPTLLGQTKGRGRQGPNRDVLSTTIKDVYILPLHRNFRRHLTAAQIHPQTNPSLP